ncbi:MAG: shikimate dehydrogenase, partial [bacterium]
TFSPAMHNAAFEHLGLNYRYLPFHVTQENLKQAVEAVRALNLVGVNVTVPHKVAVMEYLDEIDEIAEICRAVNTIVNHNGILKGYNTDGGGFIKALKEKIDIYHTKFLFLGAGGAARGAVTGLCLFKVSDIFVYNRTLEKAQTLVDHIKLKTLQTKLSVIEKKNIQDISKEVDVIVNCTSLGLHEDDPLPVSSFLIRPEHLVFDMVYGAEKTGLLHEAEQRGAETISGLEMLLYQGAQAFELWTAVEAPVEVMRQALYEKLGVKD